MKDFNGNELRVGDRVEKAREYKPYFYCRFGGGATEVPIGSRGTIEKIYADETLWVRFDNKKCWQIDRDELNRVYTEQDFKKDLDYVLDSVGNKIRAGDMVERINSHHGRYGRGDIFKVKLLNPHDSCPIIDDENYSHEIANIRLVVKNTIVKGDVVPNNVCKYINLTEGTKMELKDMKKDNIKEAKKKFQEETTNAEIEEAKSKLRYATDSILAIDRDIKRLEDSKKPHLEILEHFK